MLIIGCDYHPGFQQIAFVDTETGELGATFNPSWQVRFPSEMCERVTIEAGCPCSWGM